MTPRIRTAVTAPSTDPAYELGPVPSRERRCTGLNDRFGHLVQCEREFGHGGAHTARIETDPDWIYVVSWWPVARGGAR